MQITLEEQLAVEDHMKRMKEAIAKAAGSRIHTDATRSKPDEKLTAYRIDPFPEEAAAAWAQFTTECEKTLGGERGRSVSASFPKHLYYGDFGSRDVVVTIQEIMTDINLPHTSVTVTECDAATGAQILFRAGELELVRQYLPWDFEAK